MENLLQDLKFSLRTLRKNPGFAAIAILTLALGIGANSAIFSLIDGIILRPLPYPHAEQLVSVTGTYPRGAFVAIRQQIRTLETAAYSVGHQYNVTGRGEPFRLDTRPRLRRTDDSAWRPRRTGTHVPCGRRWAGV